MDADVMITIAFCSEVLLFALAAGLFVVHGVRKSPSKAAAEKEARARAPGARGDMQPAEAIRKGEPEPRTGGGR
jgi:hypothetical protein